MSIMTTFSLLIALAGCNDAGVTAFNASPEAAITSHVDGAEVFEGMTVTFRGSASDPDDATATLTTTWYLGTTEACPATLADDTGVTICDIAIGIDDTEVTLEVTDPGAASGSASITLTVVPTDSPDAEIVTPEASGVYYSDQKITFEGVVSDGEDASEDLIAYWESDIDGLLKDVEAVPNAEGEVLDSGYLTEGEHFLVLSAEDTTGKTGADSVTITVGPPNTAPDCEFLAPADGSAGPEGASVRFEGFTEDEDVPSDWLTVTWSSDLDGEFGESDPDTDGSVEKNHSGLSVNTHQIAMTVSDEVGATCKKSITYTVSEPPEVEITLPVDEAVFQQGDIVFFEAIVSDNEDQPDDLELVWSSNVDKELSTESANSAGNASFQADELSPGLHVITLSARDTHGLDNDDAISIRINEPPVIDSIDITPATGVTTTTTLTCTATGTDPEDGALTPALTWSNAANLAWMPTGSSVTLTAADASPGDEIACTATITDSDGAIASASTSVFVENSAPSISSVTITPNPAVAGDGLTCSYSGFADVDGDADASTLEWFVNGASEGTTATLTTTLVQGDSVMCTVTPSDGTDSGTPVSDSLTISNTAPVLVDVSLGPDPAYEGDMLVCTAGSATDVDGSAVTFDYAWTVNGGSIAATTDTLTGADFDKNDDVYCTVTPNDGTDAGAAVTSNTVTISNSAPSITDVTIDPATATASDALTCSWSGFSDADGDSDASTINWQVNGVDSGITSTVLMSGFVGGDTVTCTVTAFDGTDDGTVLSDTVVIDNTAPTLTSVTITPDPAVASDTLTCTPSGAYDTDGDSTTVEYEWNVEGVYMGSTNTLVGLFVAGNLVACRGTISDGTETGTTVTTSTTIGNTPPEAPVISITPIAPMAGEDDLVCSVDVASYDVDGDSVTYSFDWEVDGVSYGGTPTTATMSSTIPGTDPNAGETWACTVTPNDGGENGSTISTSVIIVESCAYGSDEDCPGSSCLDILLAGYASGDGTYWIETDGLGAFEAYCDMTTNGGGWTLAYSNIYDQGNPEHSPIFTSTDSGNDVEFGMGGYTNSKVRRTLAVSNLMFKHDSGYDYTTTSIYAGGTSPSILDIPTGSEYSYDSSNSTGQLPAFCHSCGFTLDGTYYADKIFIAKAGAGHRGSYFSHYDTDSENQAGLFEWYGSYSYGRVLGELSAPLGYAATGFAEVYVREYVVEPTGLGSTEDNPGLDCLDILESGDSTGDGTYWIDPDASGAFEVYCDMTNDGGGWTLALRGMAASEECRTTMMQGLATAEPPLDPNEDVGTVRMFSQSTIQAIKTDNGIDTIGIRFTRDGEGSKFIPSSCEIFFEIYSNDYEDCQLYTLTYGETPAWSTGDSGCAGGNWNPLGTNGCEPVYLESMGLYDGVVCFDAWGFGVSTSASVWVK